MAQKVSVDKSLAIRISIRDMKIMQEIPIRVPGHIPTYLYIIYKIYFQIPIYLLIYKSLPNRFYRKLRSNCKTYGR